MSMRALAGEAIGTFILITFGSLGVVAVASISGGSAANFAFLATIVVPFAFGLGLMAAIAVAGHASGGHFNPAVTLAALLDGRVTPQSALGYVVAQIIGGLAGSLAIVLLASGQLVQLTVNQPGALGDDALGGQIRAFGIELVLTAVFVAVILTATRNYARQAILIIPLTLVAIHFAAMHLSGASVNPVRSLAPAVVSGVYDSLWVYLIAPMLGAVLGWGAYSLLTTPNDEVSVEIEDEFDEEEFDEDVDDD
ncbi:MAG TPA: aquaporin [Solirubrobacterales bacterium]|nr:aquaporin [Solirubrobacterales bacterium]